MAKKMERICNRCGKREEIFHTAKTQAYCAQCAIDQKITVATQNEVDTLLGMGYTEVVLSHISEHGKRAYDVVSPCCSSKQNMLFGNICTMYKKYGKPPCPNCGGKARVAKAMQAYIDAYGRDYDETLMNDYASLVRTYSERSYRKFYEIINPNEYQRGMNNIEGTYQLDHKMSIRDCFVHSIPIELAGSILNLAMIPSLENTSKSRKSVLDLRRWVGVDQSMFAPDELVAIHDHDLVLADPENPAEHIQKYLDDTESAMVTYHASRVSNTTDAFIKSMIDYGYEKVEFDRIDNLPNRQSSTSKFFNVTHDGRTENLKQSQLESLVRNEMFFWPEDIEYSTFMQNLRIAKYKARVVTDDERANRVKAQLGRKHTIETRQKQSANKIGRKRWYHPDFSSFKQAKECPGEGWTLTKPIT